MVEKFVGKGWLIASAAFWLLGFAFLVASPVGSPGLDADETCTEACETGCVCCSGDCYC